MKVIAKTDGGYLVEATLGELVQVAGESYVNKADFTTEVPSGYGKKWTIPIGSTVNVSERFQILDALEKSRDRVLGSAAALRGMAELIDKSIPEGLTLPPAPKEEPAA